MSGRARSSNSGTLRMSRQSLSVGTLALEYLAGRGGARLFRETGGSLAFEDFADFFSKRFKGEGLVEECDSRPDDLVLDDRFFRIPRHVDDPKGRPLLDEPGQLRSTRPA